MLEPDAGACRGVILTLVTPSWGDADLPRRSLWQIQASPSDEWPSVVDFYYHRAASAQVCYSNPRSQGESLRRDGKIVLVEYFTTGGALPIKSGSVP